MNYVSTRGHAPAVGISDALLAGLAPDGGLYVPATLPTLAVDAFDGAESLGGVASRLLAPFFAGDALSGQLASACWQAFNFATPLKSTNDPSLSLLELFHGPTAAFKDVGARFLAQCLHRLHRDARTLTIVVATSGDTGAAVAAAFHRLPGLRVVVLYPDGRVSPRQAHQLGCFGDNVTALRVDGSFDDCQRLVKQALADSELQRDVPLTSANSISLGRLLPQMSYYALASLRHFRQHGDTLNFVIPTGNLGNAMAAILARAIGLPIGDIVLATNANRVLPDFFDGADYLPQDSVATLANAMDVGAPSNFERLRWLHPDPDALRSAFIARSTDDERIRATIAAAPGRYGHVVCPHTACAVATLETLRDHGDDRHYAVVATAHPSKFEGIVEPLVGSEVPPPPALAALLAKPAHADPIAADYGQLADRLRASSSDAGASRRDGTAS